MTNATTITTTNGHGGHGDGSSHKGHKGPFDVGLRSRPTRVGTSGRQQTSSVRSSGLLVPARPHTEPPSAALEWPQEGHEVREPQPPGERRNQRGETRRAFSFVSFVSFVANSSSCSCASPSRRQNRGGFRGFVVTILCGLALCTPASAQESLPITLDDAQARAEQASHRLAEARAREAAAQAAVAVRAAADQPLVSASAGYTRTNHVTPFVVPSTRRTAAGPLSGRSRQLPDAARPPVADLQRWPQRCARARGAGRSVRVRCRRGGGQGRSSPRGRARVLVARHGAGYRARPGAGRGPRPGQRQRRARSASTLA